MLALWMPTHSHSTNSNLKQQHHHQQQQQQFTRKLIDTQSVCKCMCVCAIRPKVLNAPTLLGRYFIGCRRMYEYETGKVGERVRICSSQCYSSKTIEILCKLCVCVCVYRCNVCGNHAHRTPLHNVVKTTLALQP